MRVCVPVFLCLFNCHEANHDGGNSFIILHEQNPKPYSIIVRHSYWDSSYNLFLISHCDPDQLSLSLMHLSM